MDCIIVAGNDRRYYKRVASESNKAFLKVGGVTILELILGALGDVPEVDRILVVGPKERIDRHLEASGVKRRFPKEIVVYEQRKNLINNVVHAIKKSAQRVDPERYVLIMPADIPLVTAAEIREFIARCDMDRYDYIAGLTEKEALSKFYPVGEEPGIVMNYFELPRGHYRINNLHMVRPAKCKHIVYIQRIYEMRYQTAFKNMFKMFFWLMVAFFRAPSAPFFYAGMQIFRILRRRKYKRLARLVGHGFRLEQAERYISAILGIRFKVVLTSFGGAAVDVDNDEDYRTILRRFDAWHRALKALGEKSPSPPSLDEN